MIFIVNTIKTSIKLNDLIGFVMHDYFKYLKLAFNSQPSLMTLHTGKTCKAGTDL